jgi:cyclic pyranopterin phosphate synthase
MVNVGSKPSTSREAAASARVWLGAEAFALVRENRMKKGDVLATARIAGIMGAKKTHDLIPLCHAIAIDAVKVDLTLNESDRTVDIVAIASCTGKTGVEMEALTAAAVSGLTVYDMCKAVSKDIVIGEVRLESKVGGKSGYWQRS